MKNSYKIIVGIVLFVAIYFVYSLYRIIPQGHGSEAEYPFQISKYKLENSIDSLLKNDSAVNRKPLDSTRHGNYYNEGAYFTIIIDSSEYCFRYLGDSLDWKSDSSEIFIASISTIKKQKQTHEERLENVETLFIDKLRVGYQNK